MREGGQVAMAKQYHFISYGAAGVSTCENAGTGSWDLAVREGRQWQHGLSVRESRQWQQRLLVQHLISSNVAGVSSCEKAVISYNAGIRSRAKWQWVQGLHGRPRG